MRSRCVEEVVFLLLPNCDRFILRLQIAVCSLCMNDIGYSQMNGTNCFGMLFILHCWVEHLKNSQNSCSLFLYIVENFFCLV